MVDIDVHTEWYGPVDLHRVVEEDFTAGMQLGAVGIYLWGAERGDDFRTLYVGKAEDPLERQRAHLRGQIGTNLKRIREQRWTPLFWVGFLATERFCKPGVSASYVGKVLDSAEKALIYKTKPEWNRSNSGYMTLGGDLYMQNGGRRPPEVPRVIRLRRGHHA